MGDEDLVPNVSMAAEYDSTYYADVPKERVEAESAEAAITAASYPIMASVADWFHEQAMGAMDIANIDLESKVPAEAQIQAYQMYQTIMIVKAKEFEMYRSEHD